MVSTSSPTKNPAEAPKLSICKIISVVLVFAGMLAAATMPLGVPWFWLLLPLIFLVYLDASSTRSGLVEALARVDLWVFYGGLIGAALLFQFQGLAASTSVKPGRETASSCGCGGGSSNVAAASNNTLTPVMAPGGATRFPGAPGAQRPGTSMQMRPAPGAPMTASAATPGVRPPTLVRPGAPTPGSATVPAGQTTLTVRPSPGKSSPATGAATPPAASVTAPASTPPTGRPNTPPASPAGAPAPVSAPPAAVPAPPAAAPATSPTSSAAPAAGVGAGSNAGAPRSEAK